MTQARADMAWAASARAHGEDAVYYFGDDYDGVTSDIIRAPVRIVVVQDNPVVGMASPFGGLQIGGHVRCHVEDLTPQKEGVFTRQDGTALRIRDEPRLIKPQNRVWECYCEPGAV